MAKDIPLFVEFDGRRVVAGMLSNQTFKKTVSQRDKLQLFDSFGFDCSYMEDAIALGAKKIELRVKETGVQYSIDIGTFQQHGIKRAIGKFPHRYYCSLKYWERQNA